MKHSNGYLRDFFIMNTDITSEQFNRSISKVYAMENVASFSVGVCKSFKSMLYYRNCASMQMYIKSFKLSIRFDTGEQLICSSDCLIVAIYVIRSFSLLKIKKRKIFGEPHCDWSIRRELLCHWSEIKLFLFWFAFKLIYSILKHVTLLKQQQLWIIFMFLLVFDKSMTERDCHLRPLLVF